LQGFYPFNGVKILGDKPGSVIYFCLPALGISLDPYPAGLLAIIISVGAYSTEEIRAGIQSVHKSQIESAAAIGMSTLQALRYVIFPLAFRAIYPALTNRVILVMLSSSILAAISVEELTYEAMVEGARSFRVFETYVIVGLIYLVLANSLAWVFERGKRLI
jgi:polar amino acid transport system permease protein